MAAMNIPSTDDAETKDESESKDQSEELASSESTTTTRKDRKQTDSVSITSFSTRSTRPHEQRVFDNGL